MLFRSKVVQEPNFGLMGGYLFSVSGTLVSLCNLSFSRMRKLNRLLTLVLLLVCAISMKEIVHGTGFLCSISNSPDNIVLKFLTLVVPSLSSHTNRCPHRPLPRTI